MREDQLEHRNSRQYGKIRGSINISTYYQWRRYTRARWLEDLPPCLALRIALLR